MGVFAVVRNFCIDNLLLPDVSYDFIPEDGKRQMNINGMLVGSGGDFSVSGYDIMGILKAPQSGLQDSLGMLVYQVFLCFCDEYLCF